MSKRKQTDSDDDGEQPELVDVHFDYYSVDAANDYHAVHRLLIQLFGPDAARVETGALTDLVLAAAEESGVGSTIKMDEDADADPYAILTVVGCHDRPGVRRVLEYVLAQTRADEGFHGALASLLHDQPEARVGLVLSERLVNMPVQVMGPMYRMLVEEMEAAGEGYRFTHLLFVSRAYRLPAAVEGERHSKRQRPGARSTDGVCGFHPEDDEIMAHATQTATYGYAEGGGTVGLEVCGRAMVVDGAQMAGLAGTIAGTYVAGL